MKKIKLMKMTYLQTSEVDNKVDKSGDSTDIGTKDKCQNIPSLKLMRISTLMKFLNGLSEEDEEEEEKSQLTKFLNSNLNSFRHRDVVKYLRTKLNEVNLLNKLLFTNKLFRGFGLSNDQKMKVVETFDRAKQIFVKLNWFTPLFLPNLLVRK